MKITTIVLILGTLVLVAFTNINNQNSIATTSQAAKLLLADTTENTLKPALDTLNSAAKDSINNNNIDSTAAKENTDSASTTKPKYYYGIASFYSKNLEGTPTSTQEVFTHEKLTCASNRFKLNTWLKVTNLSNNKEIIVRVNDRMHPRMDAKGRIVDLSLEGAKKLNFIAKGLTKVQVEVISEPKHHNAKFKHKHKKSNT